MPTDIEIAQAATPQDINAIAAKAGIPENYVECYG
ncbi:MAG: formate--tetrahydrofolate ligase, partial [Coriobacteriia bacterium]|nr:formate--tetrahydrofolate ligase [Coriobacteriia bacterium]